MARAMKDSGIEWIGEIPAGWVVRKLKHYYEIQTGFTPDTKKEEFYDDENGFDWVNISDIQDGKTIFNTKKKVSQLFVDQYKPTIIPKGSLLYSFKLSVGQTAFTGKNMYSNEAIAAFLPVKGANLRFLRYSSSLIIENAEVNIYNARILNRDRINNAYIVFPPEAEQNRIADYLDAKCARIDAVIEQTRASIEEYKRLKQAIITQAVTKGIRPGRKMKDSGIEWVGDIPEDWEVRRIKTLFRLRDEKNYLPLEEVNLISLYTDKGVVQHSDLEQTTGNKASNADGYKKVYENDIVVNIILCWMGAIGRSAFTGVTSPAYDIYVPSDEIECRYYHHYFRTKGFSGDCYKRGKGIMAMRWRTYSDQFRDIPVVMPSKKEQQEILAYLDAKTAEIEKLIAKKEMLLSELESYKKSLIFEYVTGRKEV